VEVEVPNPDLVLKPGMFVRTRVEFARHENATLIPFPALVRRNDKDGIFIADPQNLKARFVPVTTGIFSGELVEIIEPEISGLAVTMGNHLLEEGSDITVGQSEPAQEKQPPQPPQDVNVGSKTIPVNKSGGSR
jgi:multidrug efflux pump subunit AcrA (membrane-fusion protein)